MVKCKKYTKYLMLLFFSFTVLSALKASNGKYPIDYFSPVDYQAGNQNIDFAQNRDMEIFVANNLGVLSFDGSHWATHDQETGKKKRSILFDATDNRLYMGSQGDFGYYSENWHYTSLLDLVPYDERDFDDVWTIYNIDNVIYFCTFRAIYKYAKGKVQVIKPQQGHLQHSFNVGNRLFTQTDSGLLFEVLTTNTLAPISINYPDQTIRGIALHNAGFLVFYESGLINLHSALSITSAYPDLEQHLRGSYVNQVKRLNDGRLAIATQTKGLFLFSPENEDVEQIWTETGLASNACLASFEDFQGNLWIGMQNGLSLVRINSPMRIINSEIALQGSGYDLIDRPEGRYFTTSNGIYYQASNQNKVQLIKGTDGPAYQLQVIGDHLYAGHHKGLYDLKNGQATQIASTNGCWSVKVLHANPKYAIAGTYSGLYLFAIGDNQELIPQGPVKGFNQSSKYFEEDQHGRIWVGQYYRGLYRLDFKGNSLQQVYTRRITEEYPELPLDNKIILSKVDQEIYIGTEQGVYKLNQQDENIYPVEVINDQIGLIPIYVLQQDLRQNIFIVSDNKVGFFKPVGSEHYEYVPSSLYQLKYQFNNDLLNLAVHEANRDYISANEGFIAYDSQRETTGELNHNLFLKAVYSGTYDSLLYVHQPFEPRPEYYKEINISHDDKVIQFTVESDAFDQAMREEFRYILKGFDQSYGPWSDSNIKEYTNLPEGNYEFQVQSRNYLGQIKTSPAVFIHVQPPWHRSIFARILYVALFLLGVIVLWYMMNKQYEERTEKLNQQKLKELQEEQRKRQEIELAKEREVERLQNEKHQSELQHLNSLLAASTMNLVVKNELIETIKEDLNVVRKKGKSPETKRALEQIVKEIDTTLRVQEDWEQFEFHFDQVHGDFLDRLRKQFPELTTQDQKLCAYLRLNLSTKEIAQLMSISVRGVEIARYRLRKRLGLETKQNLSKFILEF